jgi:hypothetical protein
VKVSNSTVLILKNSWHTEKKHDTVSIKKHSDKIKILEEKLNKSKKKVKNKKKVSNDLLINYEKENWN